MCAQKMYNDVFSILLINFLLALVLCGSCINAVKIKCSHVDGFYAATPDSQCGAYYRCISKGHFEVMDCNRGQKFNINTQSCSYATDQCDEPICANHVNGVYQDLTHACRRYYTCFGGRLTTIDHCPAQYLHNGFKCVREEQYVCPVHATEANMHVISVSNTGLCKNKPNGPNTDPNSDDCSAYLMCYNGKLQQRKQCSKQAVFNGQQCVPAPLYACQYNNQNQQLLGNPCLNQKDGVHANPAHGCAAYIRCLSERLVELNTCKSQQYFDHDMRKCVATRHAEKRRCQEHGISTDCANKRNAYYAGSSCGSYYYCHNNQKLDYSCSAGKVFNGEHCVPKNEHNCALDNGFCLLRDNGYYKDEQDGCRAYKYCSNGNEISYLCDENYFFDTNSKQCIPNSGHCVRNTACLGKSDGYHADLRSNCREYIYCRNQEKIVQLICRENYVFNGQQCVTPLQYACPSLYNYRKINCLPQRCMRPCLVDGLFADLSTDCSSFYICSGGKATKSSCPLGRRFNGQLCVPADQFSCPTVCAARFEPAAQQCSFTAYANS